MNDLDPCSEAPNCVSSAECRSKRFIAPISFEADPEAVWVVLIRSVEAEERTKVTEKSRSRLAAESKSVLFGFVDDLEFLLDVDARQIQLRSAARSGWYDLGVNRRRLECIRKRFRESFVSS